MHLVEIDPVALNGPIQFQSSNVMYLVSGYGCSRSNSSGYPCRL